MAIFTSPFAKATAGVVLWFLIAGIAAIALLPHLPTNSFQWALLVVFGPPLYLVGEALGTWLFSSERGNAISQRKFSIARIGVALLIAVPLLAACWALSSLFARL